MIYLNGLVGIGTHTHPTYDSLYGSWKKFRFAYEGGDNFIRECLVRLSELESNTEFQERMNLTYSAAHAKSAVIDVQNSIGNRLYQVTRRGGDPSYKKAISNNVDNQGNTMDSFLARSILPELLPMGRVGIYIDRPVVENATRRDNLPPYLYTYQTEDILNWKENDQNELEIILLRDRGFLLDDFGLPVDDITTYRMLTKTEAGVRVEFYDKDGLFVFDTILNLEEIPFVIVEISQALMTDIANYQIALMNLSSADISQAYRANFAFYTEEFDPAAEMVTNRSFHEPVRDPNDITTTGDLSKASSAEEALKSRIGQIKVGATKGRRYPKGLTRPDFINPSSEPLKVSMDKQEQIKKDIRELMNLTLASLQPVRSSAESKTKDDEKLESGLSYIGMELEFAERKIAIIWADYMKSSIVATIKYPEKYDLKSEEDKRLDADNLEKKLNIIPSLTFKQEAAVEIAKITLESKVDDLTLEKIYKEIRAAQVIVVDPETVREDHEAGFVGTQLASEIRGYPDGEWKQAAIDHAERLKRIAEAQSDASLANAGARGVPDMGDPKDGENEKTLSRETDTEDTTKDKTRGDA